MEHDATVQDVLKALDEGDFDVTAFEAQFLESLLRQTYPLTPKQHAVLVRMAEHYCDPLLAAELRGQQRLFA